MSFRCLDLVVDISQGAAGVAAGLNGFRVDGFRRREQPKGRLQWKIVNARMKQPR